MTRGSGSVRHLIPVDAVCRVPYVLVVAPGLAVALQHPQAVEEDGHLVILTRLPRGQRDVPLPLGPVRAAPDVVVKLPLGPLGRVVGAAAEDPEATPKHRAAP